jgi:hypothetical protein
MRGVVGVGGWELRIATNGISNRHFSTSFAPPFTSRPAPDQFTVPSLKTLPPGITLSAAPTRFKTAPEATVTDPWLVPPLHVISPLFTNEPESLPPAASSKFGRLTSPLMLTGPPSRFAVVGLITTLG